ncbi:hypothetical protein TKK_0018246 [Trichogramma kaykai]|uniref:Brix domain-containing protein n=1 Tax=Trichogramma kaykai TaxID=54128 RepID=A0ABD2VZE8_9HYME
MKASKKDLMVNPFFKIKKENDQKESKKKIKEEKEDKVELPAEITVNAIRNKVVRQKKYEALQKEKKKAKKERRKARAKAGEPKQIPHTIESLREKDETMIFGSIDDEENIEYKIDMEHDEFASYYREEYEPKVLITYSDNPHTKTRIFGRELTRIIPNSISLYRNRSGVKKMVDSCIKRNFTDIIVVNENQCKPNGLLIIHLPNGPTMHCKLSNVKLTTDLKKDHKEITQHRPEVILNNFTTRLGHTCARMFGALFHYQPEFKGRRVVTFHNQRDYIFFRHHRYEFDKKTGKPRLRELGPRFTLRLRSIQHGTFDSKYGDYEWIIQGRRHQMETSRRKFFL